ncbi:MAG: ACT domain-containing protein [Pseudomonadota bacterium]
MAEKNLDTLLAGLTVKQHEGVWAFMTASEPPDIPAVMVFREREGWTAIVEAGSDTTFDNRWVWLELTVYSDLNAVGFLAVVATALAEADVPCNAVAAFHHDHIFVPEGLAKEAVEALNRLHDEAGAPK